MIADEHGYANMIVGDGSEMVECEIDPCDIVIEVDEEDKCWFLISELIYLTERRWFSPTH